MLLEFHLGFSDSMKRNIPLILFAPELFYFVCSINWLKSNVLLFSCKPVTNKEQSVINI